MPLACLPYSIAINSRRPLDQRDWQVQTELAAVRWLDCLAWRVPPKYSAEHKRLRHLWSLSSVRLGPSGEEIQVTGRQMTRCGKRNCRTVSFCWADRTSSHASSSEVHVVNTFTLSSFSVLERPNLKKILTSTGWRRWWIQGITGTLEKMAPVEFALFLPWTIDTYQFWVNLAISSFQLTLVTWTMQKLGNHRRDD